MRLARRLAVRISKKAVEKAGPRCKEWAEGLAREVEFIESDWSALAWAVGSTRVLLRNPPKPFCNAAEIARAGRLFAGNREHVPPMIFLLMAMQVFDNVERLVFRWGRTDDLQRAGFLIAAVSAAYLAMVGWMEHRMGKRPEDMDDGAWIDFYRREMVRLRDLFSGFGILFPAAIVSMCAGNLLGTEDATRPYLTVCFTAACLVMLRLVSWPAERFQRKLDGLDSILRQGGRQA
jgi:hypothetical protein